MTGTATSSTGRAPLPWQARVALGLAAWIASYLVLEPVSVWLVSFLPLAHTSALYAAAAFFLYEVPKVLLLLAIVVFAIGIVRTFFSVERTRALLAGKNEALGNAGAASLGILTPFCSCSAVPMFLGFVSAGVPLGVTFSFLIASPMINEIALGLLFALAGWKVALAYLLFGLAVAIAAGWVIGRLHLESWLEPWVQTLRAAPVDLPVRRMTASDRVDAGIDAVKEIVGKVWLWVIAGIAVGAFIHGYVPNGILAAIMGRGAWWSVPAAVIIGVPMYSNAAGIIPVVQALLEKGAALGTVLAFMMSVTALSLPEIIILRKVLSLKLIAVFAGTVALGILAVGYLFNIIFV
jgi:uncharacterized membrane protein YraQ (UPF0718 family)